MSIQTKLHAIQSRISQIEKAGENKFQKYTYVMLGTILEKVKSPLEDHLLTLTQSVVSSDTELIFKDDKTFYTKGFVEVNTTLTDAETGESVSVLSVGFSIDKNGDKAVFKAITGARKYGLSLLFKAHWDAVEAEDDRLEPGADYQEAHPRHAQQKSPAKSSPKPSAQKDTGWF